MVKTPRLESEVLHASEEVEVEVWEARAQITNASLGARDSVVCEVPVALVYNGISHAVMMATPQHLDDLALGFSLSEAIIDSSQEVYDIQRRSSELGVEIELTVSGRSFDRLKDKRRSMSGRTGCGICGAESLQQLRLPLTPLPASYRLAHAAIQRALTALQQHQPLQAATGGVHAAAWCDLSGQISLLREDVGRHNALDKLIGASAKGAFDTAQGFLLISSRASYEVVQKAAVAGMAIVVAVSAPTSFAIQIAKQSQICLVGFARQGRHVVYSHSQRLVSGDDSEHAE